MTFNNTKNACFFLVCGHKKIGSGPCCIVISLIIILFVDSNRFSLTLYHNQRTFFVLFIFFGTPHNNISTRLPLPAMPIGNGYFLPHLFSLIQVFVCQPANVYLANLLFRSGNQPFIFERTIYFIALNLDFHILFVIYFQSNLSDPPEELLQSRTAVRDWVGGDCIHRR